MAGAKIEITRDTATPAVQQALKGLAGDAVRVMLSDIGEYLLRSTRDRALTETSPDGQPWAPLSPRYKAWKEKKRPGLPILRFDFHMMGDQFSYQVGDQELQVGTNAKYGAIHQFGGDIEQKERATEVFFRRGRDGSVGNRFVKRSRSDFAQPATVPAYKITMPARPWLGLSAVDETEVVAIAHDHLQRLFE